MRQHKTIFHFLGIKLRSFKGDTEHRNVENYSLAWTFFYSNVEYEKQQPNKDEKREGGKSKIYDAEYRSELVASTPLQFGAQKLIHISS